jgi:hypothetical protein
VIEHVGPGQYRVSLSGFGTGCPVTQVNPAISNFVFVTFGGGSCGFGNINHNDLHL